MPFQSEKQRRFLHANHPEIAKRWERDYANGGILDINESEEIISDDGNDIELTAYNAEFDDPNDLSTGVKTLFQAKDGGTPQLAKKSKDGKRPGYGGPHDSYDAGQSYSGGNQGSDQGHSRFEPGSGYYGETVTTTTPVSTGGEWSGDVEDDPNMPGGSPWRAGDHHPTSFSPTTGEDEYGGGDYIGPQDSVRIHDSILDKHAHRFKPIKDLTWEQRGRWAKDRYADYTTAKGFMAIASGPFGWLSAADAIRKAEKRKKETLNELKTDIKTLTDLGYPTHHPTVDTLIQSLNQEILNMTQPKAPKDTDGGDGPPVSVPVVTEELEEATDEGEIDMFDAWSEIKRKQALNAGLQAKWAAEQEARDQSFMVANKGGLANLFRVKKQ
jgi:hypothetical protein